jgi:hypothetical protein
MATTTPNFGWSVPTSTDLVKDGATAIETLGDAIDASLVDLKGGTSGQILSKNSNTDMDFTWVTSAGDIEGVSVTSPITGGGTSGTVTIGIDSTAVVPSQTGNSGKYLTTNGTSSSWATVSSGAVVQVKSAVYSTSSSTSSTSYVDTGLSISITPTSASNKILVFVSQNIYSSHSGNSTAANIRLLRDATAIHTVAETHYWANNTGTNPIEMNIRQNMNYLDSPATTSSITYKTQQAANQAGDQSRANGSPSTITVMEVTP